ncbi:hypothetical protein B0H66DRAFT_72633 [Apodospora peruviana]|uniref:C2H2-type domain-containing protein n=1 Tax=Apodospora peruviana TaxID=516989 RepID=A0AAE0ITF4_9PEZI|nr:hypothetical protein B0H66DRAFT_72633 [Apodospora peruviana]
MDPFRNPPADSLAAARLHVQALTECGLPREALLRALLENYGPSDGDRLMTMETGGFAQNQQQQQLQQQQTTPPTKMGPASYNARLSVSTTSSARSSARASVMSTSTSLSSVSSQSPQEMALPSAPAPAPPVKPNNRGTSKSQGAFWCTFCDVAFQRKFDWKRHEDEFHERYKRYPCPNCNRIFWGANTFNQHHKNAHGCTTCPHADTVVKYTQRKQAWACGFCGGFLASRDRYFDHVARHYEDGCNKTHWNHSLVIYGLLHQPSITHAWKELDTELYGHLPRGQQPMLEWDLKATGHAQGFLEGESPGKLQDLLEFFNDNTDDPRFLARLAHDQANIKFRHELPAAPPSAIARPISEPPKQRTKPSMSSLSSSTSKHMSAPQQQHPSKQANNPFGNFSSQYDNEHHRVQKKQRSVVPSMSGLSSPTNAVNLLAHTQHAQHAHAQAQLEQHAAMMAAAASSSPFPQTIVETPETPDNHFFEYSRSHHQHHHHQQHHQQHHQHQHQHHGHQHQHQHQPHEQPQQPQQLALPNPMAQHSLFEDWSSMTTTVVDESAAFPVAEGWESGLSGRD